MEIYIVRRESAEGLEVDTFTDPTLAQEWADCIGEVVETEQTIDRDTLDAMKESRLDNENDENDNLHEGMECAECGATIDDEDDGESTYCGSMHTACRDDHNEHCEPCAND